MRYKPYLIYTLLSIVVYAPAKTAKYRAAEVDAIIQEIDKLYRANSSYAEIEMEIVTPNWERTLAMRAWSIGTEKTFVRITSPKKEEGVGTLRIENEMWNYLPKTNKVIKVPPSMMMSSWMGSDFTNDDMVKEFSLFEDYTYELITGDTLPDSLIFINCIPRDDLPVVWNNIITIVFQKSHLPLRQEYYDEHGELMRTMHYSDVTTFEDRTIPATLELVPAHEEGHKTVVRYKSIRFNTTIDENIFSLRHLRSSD